MALVLLVAVVMLASARKHAIPDLQALHVPDLLSGVGETDDFEPSKMVLPLSKDAQKVADGESKKTTKRRTTKAVATTRRTTAAATTTQAPVEPVATEEPHTAQQSSGASEQVPNALITVAGDATVDKSPNQVSIHLRVHTTGGATTRDTRESHTKNCMPVRAVLHSFFAKHGNLDDKIVRESLSLTPRYIYSDGRNEFKGYEAVTSFLVTIDEISENGKLVDDATSAGAIIESVTMGLKQTDAKLAMDEARRLAVRGALTTADVEAAEAGLEVVSVAAISSAGQAGIPQPMMAMRAMAMDAGAGGGSQNSVDPGVLSFSASVTVQVRARPKHE